MQVNTLGVRQSLTRISELPPLRCAHTFRASARHSAIQVTPIQLGERSPEKLQGLCHVFSDVADEERSEIKSKN